MISELLRMARQIVDQVQQQLTQQLNIVEEQAKQPVMQIVQTIMGGAWIGEGANALVSEIGSMLTPGLNNVSQNISTFQNNLRNAVEVMDQADQQVNSMAGGLADLFSNIFSG